MPSAAPKPCIRCGVLVRGGNRCPAHQVREGTFADRQRGTRHQRGYGAEWDKKRALVLARDCGLCQPCQRVDRVTVGNIVDHVVAKAAGGTDVDGNLQSICKTCHDAKTAIEKRGGTPAWPLVPAR